MMLVRFALRNNKKALLLNNSYVILSPYTAIIQHNLLKSMYFNKFSSHAAYLLTEIITFKQVKIPPKREML